MLKNWLVKTSQIRTSFGHISYLSNQNAKSHDATRIVVLKDGAKSIINANDKRAEFRKENKLKGAYRVKNEATSFILSIPRDITQLSDKQWTILSKYVLQELLLHLNHKIDKQNEKYSTANLSSTKKKQPILQNISEEEFFKHCHVVLHDESASSDKKNHLHIIVSNIMNNEVIKPITQTGATYNIKQSFNYAMKKLVNEDHMKYQPNTSVFRPEDEDFSEKKPVEIRPKYFKYASEFKEIFDRVKSKFKEWLNAIHANKKLIVADLAVEISNDINSLENVKNTEVSIIIDTAKIVEKNHNLAEPLKISNKVKTRKRRRRKNKNSQKNN